MINIPFKDVWRKKEKILDGNKMIDKRRKKFFNF